MKIFSHDSVRVRSEDNPADAQVLVEKNTVQHQLVELKLSKVTTLSQEIAALVGGQAVLTGAGSAQGRLPLDAFGQAWGWRRGAVVREVRARWWSARRGCCGLVETWMLMPWRPACRS